MPITVITLADKLDGRIRYAGIDFELSTEEPTQLENGFWSYKVKEYKHEMGIGLWEQIHSIKSSGVPTNDYWDVLNAEAGKALRVRPRAFITLYETTKQNGASLFVNKGIPTYVDDLEIYLDIDKDSTIESITEQLKGTPGIQSIKIL